MKTKFKRITIFLLSALLVICLWPSAVFGTEGGGVSSFSNEYAASIDPAEGAFGIAEKGYTSAPEIDFTITNDGTEDLEVASVALGLGASSPFTVADLEEEDPIAKETSIEFTVSANLGLTETGGAGSDGIYSDTLTIGFDEGDNLVVNLTFRVVEDIDYVFTIKFDANANNALLEIPGINPGDPKKTVDVEYVIGDKWGALPQPTRPGFDFVGWFSTAAATGGTAFNPAADDEITAAPAGTLFARWATSKYNVTFDALGGSIKMPAAQGGTVVLKMSVMQTFNAKYKLPPNPTRGGYKFGGWFDGDKQVTKNINVPANADATPVVAKWTANRYNITFNGNGGRFGPASNSPTTQKVFTVEQSGKVVYVEPAVKPVRSGYEFAGWSTKKNNDKTIVDISNLTNFKNHTLFALWVGADHHIVFDANGGTAVDTFPHFDNDDGWKQKYRAQWPAMSANWPVAKPTLANANDRRVFQGWSRTKAASGAVEGRNWTQALNAANATMSPVLVDDTVDAEVYESGIKLFAIYGTSATVNYKLNGGTLKQTGKSVNTAINTKLGALPTPKRAGYKFDGWYIDDRKVTKDTYVWSDNTAGNAANPVRSGAFDLATLQNGKHGAKHLAIEAKWIKNAYVVTLDRNGGVLANGVTKINGVTDDTLGGFIAGAKSPADPIRNGNTFLGWSTSKSAAIINPATATPISKNIKLFARWAVTDKKVTFDANKGTFGATSKIVLATGAVQYGDIYGLAINEVDEPKRAGFTFAGWFDKKSKGNRIGHDTLISAAGANITLFAQWIPNTTRTVTLNANGGSIINPNGKVGVAKLTTFRAMQNMPYGEGTYVGVADVYGLPEVKAPANAAHELAFDGWWTAKTKTAKGAYRVTDASVMSITKNHNLWAQWKTIDTANPGISAEIKTNLLESVKTGGDFSYALWAVGDDPITWTLDDSDNGPFDWLKLNEKTGKLTGKAPAVSSDTEYDFTVIAENEYGYDSQDLTLTVLALSASAAISPSGPFEFPLTIATEHAQEGGGFTYTNNAKDQVFTITNTGTKTLTDLEAELDLAVPSFTIGKLSRDTLIPGASATITVRPDTVAPMTTAYTNKLLITAEELAAPITVDLSAFVVSAQVAVTGVKAVTGDGTDPATNVGKYTVGAPAGAVPNYEVMVTARESLIEFPSDNLEQGSAKWIGVLISLDVDLEGLLVGAPGFWTEAEEANVEEAQSAGAGDSLKTLVWWLKSENIPAEGRTIQIKKPDAPDSAATKVTVKFTDAVNAAAPVIISNPVGGTVIEGTAFTLAVSAAITDGGTRSVQWFKNDSNTIVGAEPISGATGLTYRVPTALADAGTTFYFAAVTNTNNRVNGAKTTTVNSSIAAVEVVALVHAQKPVIDTQPDDATKDVGQALTLEVAATSPDGGDLSYQWYKNANNNTADATAIPSATAATYVVPTDVAGTTYYYVVVTNTNNDATGNKTATETSSIVEVKVLASEAPSIAVTAYSFDKYAEATNYKDVAITVSFGTGSLGAEEVVSVTGNGITSGDYTIVDNVVTLKKEFLATLAANETPYTFAVLFDDDAPTTVNITVTVIDTTPTGTPPSIADGAVAVDLNTIGSDDKTVSVSLGTGDFLAYGIQKISANEENQPYDLVAGNAYTYADGVITLKNSYLTGLKAGTVVLTVTFGNMQATTATITITVTGTAPAPVFLGYFEDDEGEIELVFDVEVESGTLEEDALAALPPEGYALFDDDSFFAITIEWELDGTFDGDDEAVNFYTGEVSDGDAYEEEVEGSVMILAAEPEPTAISDLAATVGDREVSLTWTAATGATEILVQIALGSTPAAEEWVTLGTTALSGYDGDEADLNGAICAPPATSATSAKVTGLKNNLLYSFRLYVADGANAGHSNAVTATPVPTLVGFVDKGDATGVALVYDVTVPFGTAEEDADAGLPTAGFAKMSDDTYIAITIEWEIDETFVGTAEAENAYTGTVSGGYGTVEGTVTILKPTVVVGAQAGEPIVEGTAGSATYTVTFTNIVAGTYAATVATLPAGVTFAAEEVVITITENVATGTLTLAVADTALAGTINLTLAVGGTTSVPFALLIEEPITP